jgi:hypothetical protein
MNFAATLRHELAQRAHKYAAANSLPHSLSYGEFPTVCFEPFIHGTRHGNFLPASYKSILANPAWSKRLSKIHTQGRHCLPATGRGRWMELDTCNQFRRSADEHLLPSASLARQPS